MPYARQRIISGLYRRMPLIGAAVGGGLGGVEGFNYPDVPRPKEFRKRRVGESEKKYLHSKLISESLREKHHKESRRSKIMGGVASGAFSGYMLGTIGQRYIGAFGQFGKAGRTGRTGFSGRAAFAGPKTEFGKSFKSSIGKVKTKAEAKSAFRKASLKTHPDKGGKADDFIDIKNVWDDFHRAGKFDKLAFLNTVYNRSFNSNIEKIARELIPEEKWKIWDLNMKKRKKLLSGSEWAILNMPSLIGAGVGYKKYGLPGLVKGSLIGSLVGYPSVFALRHFDPKTRAIRKEIKEIKQKAKNE